MNEVLDWFSRYGYYAVFFPVMLEPVGIPFPAETILLAGGATAKLGGLSLLNVIAIGYAAAVVGATLGFYIGVYGGRPLIDWGVRKRLMRREHIERVTTFFDRHGGKTLVFIRFVPGVRIPTFWLAGASGMPLRVYSMWNAIGAAVWVVTIVLLGYVFASSVDTVSRLLGRDAVIALFVVIVLVIAADQVRRRLRPRA